MRFELREESNTGIFSGGRSIGIALLATALLFALSSFSGCANFLGRITPDPEEGAQYEQEPTYGGRFVEGGLLEDDENAESGRLGGRGSWVENSDDRSARRPSPAASEHEDAQNQLAARPVLQKKYKNGNRATRSDFVDDVRNDGSLWNSDGQTNYFVTKNNVHTDGHIVSVITDDEFIRDVAAELKRTMTPDEREAEIEVAQERLRRKMLGLPEDAVGGNETGDKVASAQSSANRAPAAAGGNEGEKQVDVPNLTWNDVDLRKSMEIKPGDPVMAEIVERYPNGNYKIRGLKRIRVRGQTRMVSLLAIARHNDISPEDTIPSGKLYEYRIESVR